jgi:hypothetical protein
MDDAMALRRYAYLFNDIGLVLRVRERRVDIA